MLDFWIIAVSLKNSKNLYFQISGGLWNSKVEWNQKWAQVPECEFSTEKETFFLDKLDNHGRLVGTKQISRTTVEQLVGNRLDELVSYAKKKRVVAVGDHNDRQLLEAADETR